MNSEYALATTLAIMERRYWEKRLAEMLAAGVRPKPAHWTEARSLEESKWNQKQARALYQSKRRQ